MKEAEIMIELIYNEDERSAAEEGKLQEPKNIRQIGIPGEYKKIYVEDYVHTFLLRYGAEEDTKAKIAILLGMSKKAEGKRQIYIKSALPVENVEEKQGKYQFSEMVWGTVYQECTQYFPHQEILGWFLSKPGISTEKTEMIEETHRTYFSGAEKVLLVMNPSEQEQSFLGFDGNRFVKQPGYCIYYEKNEPMQEFLVKKSEGQEMTKKSEKPDVVMANFRKILQEKQQSNEQRKKQVLTYGMKVSILLILFVGAVALKNQTDRVQQMEQQLQGNLMEGEAQETSGDDVIVEELPGNVEEQPKIIEETEEIPEGEPLPVEETVAETPQEEPPVEMEKKKKAEEPVSEILEQTVQETAAPAYEEYMVQQGDTLAKISRDRYGNEEMIDQICQLNGISDGDYIQVGEIILLP